MSTDYRNFLALSYSELEDLNLAAKADRAARISPDEIREKRIKYLTDEKRIKAVTVLFSDLEGRLHLLDYDKKFLLGAYENLTFDGSSIRGFTAQAESDLRLGIDWGAFYWVPADVFGPGKVLIFGTVIDKDGSPYSGDIRGVLKVYADKLYREKNYTLNAANEIEGFLFAGKDAEQRYHETGKFEFISSGGYYHALPLDPLRQFIDTSAEVQRAMGFQNEKDHPEVAPSQFEINYGYGEVVAAADQIQLYKLLTRQIANSMGYTACYLPKPVVGVNGSGMHTNVSISQADTNGVKTNLFWDPNGLEKLSQFGWDFIDHILTNALDLCLIMNPSVNSYRRLDPHFEAPNQIKASATDRGSMIRVPIGNSRSMRVEVRAVAPDANPYLTLYSIFKTGIDGSTAEIDNLRQAHRYLPDNIQLAIEDFKASPWITEILGADVQGRFADLKQAAADRSPRELGTFVKGSEVQYHHEVYNQSLWNHF
ncbi:MAG: glutamine synthetase family protein [Terracidiphilus sp.]|jgi:glutamine synthetase